MKKTGNIKEFLMVFTDYKKAFDTVNREQIRKSLEKNWNCRPFEKSEKYIQEDYKLLQNK
jgi:hypothetical protein